MYYVVGALRRCGVRGGGVRKTFTLACVWLWVVGVSQCLRRLSCVIYRSAGIYMASVRARGAVSLFPFFSPPDATVKLACGESTTALKLPQVALAAAKFARLHGGYGF